jgi:hypothetical protein
MKYLLILLFFPILLQANPANLDFSLQKKSSTTYLLSIIVPKGYALQKDAPNKIQVQPSENLKVVKFSSELKGKVFLDKPEYFQTIEPLSLELKGKGELSVEAKLFYCDLEKGICYPSKISKKLPVP